MSQHSRRLGLVAALVLSVGSSAIASDFVVNPDTLRTQMYSGDTTVYTGLNTLYQSKEQVNNARANLLPSLNVSAVVGASPKVALSLFQVAIPFLLPSNWANLDASKKQLTADGYAYQLVLLNEYASLLQIYETVQGDQALRNVFVTERDALQGVVETVADEVAAGVALQSDLALATAAKEHAETQIAQTDQALAQEIPALRKAMGLTLAKNIVIAPYHFGELDAENSSMMSVYNRVLDASPEVDQVNSLIAAAHDAKISTEWSFLTGSAANVSTDYNGSSFGHLSYGAGVDLGFGLLPRIHLSSLDIAAMNIRKREITLELQRLTEQTVDSIVAGKTAVTQASNERDDDQVALQTALDQYRAGNARLLDVLQVVNQTVQGGIDYAQAVTSLDNQRIQLNRILVANQFAKVPTCHLQKVKGGGIFGFFKSIFGSKRSRYTSIDDMCRPSGAAASAARGDNN